MQRQWCYSRRWVVLQFPSSVQWRLLKFFHINLHLGQSICPHCLECQQSSNLHFFFGRWVNTMFAPQQYVVPCIWGVWSLQYTDLYSLHCTSVIETALLMFQSVVLWWNKCCLIVSPGWVLVTHKMSLTLPLQFHFSLTMLFMTAPIYHK